MSSEPQNTHARFIRMCFVVLLVVLLVRMRGVRGCSQGAPRQEAVRGERGARARRGPPPLV